MRSSVFKMASFGIALIAGGGIAVPQAASAATRAHDFLRSQHALEAQLSIRVSQLNRLQTDITATTTLPGTEASTLAGTATNTLANINALAAKVPTDSTLAQLRVDRNAMIRKNRVFAVITPQVFLTLEANTITNSVASMHNEEAGLLSAVNGLVGQHGYTTALARYNAFVKLVNDASLGATNAANSVLSQMPADFPRDTSVFVRTNRALLHANISLARASYDATLVGLVSGGYSGS